MNFSCPFFFLLIIFSILKWSVILIVFHVFVVNGGESPWRIALIEVLYGTCPLSLGMCVYTCCLCQSLSVVPTQLWASHGLVWPVSHPTPGSSGILQRCLHDELNPFTLKRDVTTLLPINYFPSFFSPITFYFCKVFSLIPGLSLYASAHCI